MQPVSGFPVDSVHSMAVLKVPGTWVQPSSSSRRDDELTTYAQVPGAESGARPVPGTWVDAFSAPGTWVERLSSSRRDGYHSTCAQVPGTWGGARPAPGTGGNGTTTIGSTAIVRRNKVHRKERPSRK